MRLVLLIIGVVGILSILAGAVILAVVLIPDGKDDSTSFLPRWTAPERIYFRRGSEIWSVRPDGSETTLVYAKAHAGYGGTYLLGNTGIAPSPQGERVAFLDENGTIQVVDSAGRQLHSVSDVPKPADDTYYGTHNLISGWSPDGTRLIYFVGASEEEEQKTLPSDLGFYLFDLITEERSKLEKLTNFRMWSRDRDSVIFVEPLENSDWTDWFRFDLTHAAKSQITKEPFPCFSVQPAPYSKDQRLIYACGDTDKDESYLVLANNDNTNRRVLQQGIFAELQLPILSPDGRVFVYRHQSPPGVGGQVAFEIRVFDLDTHEEQVLIEGCAFAEAWVDETSILIEESTTCEGGTVDLYKVNIHSGAKTLLASEVDAN